MTDATQATPSFLDKDTRNWAMACHFAALTGLVSGLGFLLGPLIVWLVKREDHPYIDEQGKEAINFQITMFIAMLICVPLVFVIIGIVLLPLLGIANVLLTIIAGIKAANGEAWRYPLTLRLVN